MEYKVRALIVDNQIRCASQMCEDSCPNYKLCVEAILIVEEEYESRSK